MIGQECTLRLGRFGLTAALCLSVAALLAGCGSSSGVSSEPSPGFDAHPIIRTRNVYREPGARRLEPAVRGPGAASVCAKGGGLATIKFGPDVPRPRCIQAPASARLRLVNRTGAYTDEPRSIAYRFAGFAGSIRPDEAVVLAGPIGSYLKPGRHLIGVHGA